MSTYRMDFINNENIACRVDISVSDSASNIISIAGSSRPFILREFNTDMDYFKPIRPMQAEISILAADGLNVDVFINAVGVDFYYGGTLYWTGFVIQDEFQEYWIDTEHIFTIRATDNFDKQVPYPYNTGLVNFFDALGYAYGGTGGISFYESRIINGLFYFGMNDFTTGDYIALSQAYFDQKSLQRSPTETDDSYEVAKKINRAWSQTMFQYQGEWWFFRMEEPLNNPTTFRGVVWTPLAPGGNGTINTRWDYNIGVNEDIKVIETSLLRTINRQTKYDKITINYQFPPELVCNQNFQRGNYIQTVTISSSVKAYEYEIDCWELQDITSSFAYPGTAIGGTTYVFRRREFLTNGEPSDDAGWIYQGTTNKTLVAKSDGIRVQADQRLTFHVDVRFPTDRTGSYEMVRVLLVADNGNKYFMDYDGKWYATNTTPPFTTNQKVLQLYWAANEDASQYKTFSIRRPNLVTATVDDYAEDSDLIPYSGYIYIYLNSYQYDGIYFSNMQVEVKFDNVNKRATGSYDQYTQDNELKKFEDEIFFDDMINGQYQGAIASDSSYTLTKSDKWYRYQFEPETLGFKQCNAIGEYLLHKRPRMKLDGKFFGLNGTTNPIGLHQTFIFTDDAPTKQFMILNLNEIDFYAATWSATLIETYDTDIDDNDPANYDPYSTGFVYK